MKTVINATAVAKRAGAATAAAVDVSGSGWSMTPVLAAQQTTPPRRPSVRHSGTPSFEMSKTIERKGDGLRFEGFITRKTL